METEQQNFCKCRAEVVECRGTARPETQSREEQRNKTVHKEGCAEKEKPLLNSLVTKRLRGSWREGLIPWESRNHHGGADCPLGSFQLSQYSNSVTQHTSLQL